MRNIAFDKWKHFLAGIVLGIILQALAFYFFETRMLLGTGIAFVLLVGISYGFELFSKITALGYHDIMDAIATIIGGIAGMGLFAGLYFLSS